MRICGNTKETNFLTYKWISWLCKPSILYQLTQKFDSVAPYCIINVTIKKHYIEIHLMQLHIRNKQTSIMTVLIESFN